MSSPTFSLGWGIIGCGSISARFVKDILLDPKTRGANDVEHRLVAVGSRSNEKAQDFLGANAETVRLSVAVYEKYTDLYSDKNVNAVYIGLPHTLHYDEALAAIRAKKHILCEKPATTNAPELKALLAAAKENGVFFMEAMWTRFLPITTEVKRVIDEGKLGKPVVVHADLSGNFDIENVSTEHRIMNPLLAGGAILDLGPYPLVWAIVALFEHPSNADQSPTVTSSMIKTPRTNVDSNTSFTLNFPKLAAQAVLSCSINLDSFNPGVVIRFEKGSIELSGPVYRPEKVTVRYPEGSVPAIEEKTFEFEGGGWHFQADEVARCVRDGKLESGLWTHRKSVLAMEIFDEVRKQGNYVLPAGIEKVT
ncbi:hypothetical protein BDV98DRAFT_552575 [Pterulicium gracile]|uniref:D-xylose 1-dehydrogenase (NADP(+), D-xylono-1,5-lactone-forming) n=1 Tax=Pterulicium gracile TaxID=1884261 RepID=A0A5C3QAX2_9AGAR|nr:hypothetical protein BDV98DRAFT_552575 [Pterula gracilis]